MKEERADKVWREGQKRKRKKGRNWAREDVDARTGETFELESDSRLIIVPPLPPPFYRRSPVVLPSIFPCIFPRVTNQSFLVSKRSWTSWTSNENWKTEFLLKKVFTIGKVKRERESERERESKRAWNVRTWEIARGRKWNRLTERKVERKRMEWESERLKGRRERRSEEGKSERAKERRRERRHKSIVVHRDTYSWHSEIHAKTHTYIYRDIHICIHVHTFADTNTYKCIHMDIYWHTGTRNIIYIRLHRWWRGTLT